MYFHLQAQNLVLNPSFELLDTCLNHCETEIFTQNLIATDWYNPTLQTPDIFSPCNIFDNIEHPYLCSLYYSPSNWMGYQYANTGENYAGYFAGLAFTNPPTFEEGFREYLTGKLVTPLQPRKYCVSLSFSAGASLYFKYISGYDNYFYAAINKIGINFTDVRPFYNSIDPIILEPSLTFVSENSPYFSDTLNWRRISKSYNANGGERYFTIGNFYLPEDLDFEIFTDFTQGQTDTLFDATVCYHYIDDVEVVEIPELKAQTNDSVIIAGNTAQLYSPTIAEEYTWFEGDTINAIGHGNNLLVSPTETTEYYLKALQCKLTTWDTVTVIVNPKPLVPINISIIKTLTSDHFKINYVGDNRVELNGELFNSVGQIVREFRITGSADVDVSEFASGVYYFRLRSGDVPVLTEKIVKVN